MLGKKIQENLESIFSQHFREKTGILKVTAVGGGCINNTVKLETTKGTFFVKYNHANRYPGMFEAEAKGLRILRETGEIFVPEVICYGEKGDEAFLALGFVQPGKRLSGFFGDFGIRLAKLHRHSSEKFGIDHDNYIGSLPQSNTFHSSWVEFFIVERMEKQIKLARDCGVVSSSTIQQFNRLFSRLNEIFPEEKPSLLHGDLWNGNYMTAPDGTPCIVDPAVYYGFREMDIAMSKLFGGFSPEFYSCYTNEFPLEKGWESRIDLCNLYPLMVHVNLFGGAYIYDVRHILKRF
jgi:fructosamine-3-kinase